MSGAERGAFLLAAGCWGRCVACLLPPRRATIAGEGGRLWEKYIAARYTEPQRHYHTLAHLEEMLRRLDEFEANAPAAHRLPAGGTQRLVLELALLFHDAVYDPQRGDNEERSAVWFESFWEESRLLATTGGDAACEGPLLWDDARAAEGVRAEVVDFILKTKHHMSVVPCYTHRACRGGDATPPPPPALHIFLDLDLAVLGSEADRYRQYASDIRKEYAWHSEADYCRGRAAFLRDFLSHPQWFKTKFFCDLLEEAARTNVEAEVAALEARLAQITSEGPN